MIQTKFGRPTFGWQTKFSGTAERSTRSFGGGAKIKRRKHTKIKKYIRKSQYDKISVFYIIFDT